MMFETQSRRMAMAASPAPRKIALLRNSKQHGTTAAQTNPGVAAADRNDLRRSAHQAKQVGRKQKQGIPIATETIRPSAMA